MPKVVEPKIARQTGAGYGHLPQRQVTFHSRRWKSFDHAIGSSGAVALGHT